MSSLAELESRVTLLELVLDALPGGREMLYMQRSAKEQQAQGGNAPTIAPTVRKNIPVLLTIHAYSFSSYREARECLEAIALCKGLGLIGVEFPADWLQQLESVRHARVHGMTWRQALERAGLTVPSDLMEHALQVARETERIEGLMRVALQETIAACPHNLQTLYLPLLESLLED